MYKTVGEMLQVFEDKANDSIFYGRMPCTTREELVQWLMSRKQLLTQYVGKHQRDRARGKHVLAYLERKENEELAAVKGALDRLGVGL